MKSIRLARKLLIASALTVGAASAFGQTTGPTDLFISSRNYYEKYNNRPVDATLLSALTNAMVERIFILPSDISTFSYMGMANVGFSSQDNMVMTNSRITRNLHDLGASFWDPDAGVDGNVSGLYVAFVPAQTASYGGEDPFLLQVKLPQGTRAFAVHTRKLGGKMNIDSGLKNVLRQMGCPVDGDSAWQDMFVSLRGSRDCRTVVRAAILSLKIEAILYPFFQEGSSCLQFSDNTAAILFPADYIKPRTVQVYSRSIPNPDPYSGDRAAISSYYPIMQRAHSEIVPMWPSLQTPLDFDINAWNESNLWGCTPGFKAAGEL
jgi:hypothetical protein